MEFACGMVKLGSSVVMASAEHIDLLFDGHKTIKFEVRSVSEKVIPSARTFCSHQFSHN